MVRMSAAELARVDSYIEDAGAPFITRPEAIRRLVNHGLRFALAAGDAVMTPAGLATVTRPAPAIGSVEVQTKDGSGHVFPLSDVEVSG